ncbi:MAG: secondary thiamine-phosphate synthase enzyme YjbQ [Cellvibrionaceae bacterium]
MIQKISVVTCGQGLCDVTAVVQSAIAKANIKSTLSEGLATLYLQHTSASLLIQENYDPSAKHDLEKWMNRLVPENDPLYTHTIEGPDDMPAHIKAALTAISISIPIVEGALALGAWQGIYLWEHRHEKQQRTILIHTSS